MNSKRIDCLIDSCTCTCMYDTLPVRRAFLRCSTVPTFSGWLVVVCGGWMVCVVVEVLNKKVRLFQR